MIHITDMDRIERSNLSRQFLFRERHIGELKSTTAAQAAQAMNPSLNIRAYDLAVGKATEVDFNEVCTFLHLCRSSCLDQLAHLATDEERTLPCVCLCVAVRNSWNPLMLS